MAVAKCIFYKFATNAEIILYMISFSYRQPISTSVNVHTANKVHFPHVIICNTNPVEYSAIQGHELDDVVEDAFEKYSVDEFNISLSVSDGCTLACLHARVRA